MYEWLYISMVVTARNRKIEGRVAIVQRPRG